MVYIYNKKLILFAYQQMYLNDVLTMPANIAGIPGISVPAGIVDGLPVGLQIMTKSFNEETLFRIAYAYEQATDWHNMKSELID